MDVSVAGMDVTVWYRSSSGMIRVGMSGCCEVVACVSVE